MADPKEEDEDDLFARFGGSLMRDLLSDISTATTATSEQEGLLSTLATLERELEEAEEGTPPPGLKLSSAAALVVGDAAAVPQLSQRHAATSSDDDDAWAKSLSQFSAFTDDFLRADSARKKKTLDAAPLSDSAPLEGDEGEDYDIHAEATLARNLATMRPSRLPPPQPPPGVPHADTALPPSTHLPISMPPHMHAAAMTPLAILQHRDAGHFAHGMPPSFVMGLQPHLVGIPHLAQHNPHHFHPHVIPPLLHPGSIAADTLRLENTFPAKDFSVSGAPDADQRKDNVGGLPKDFTNATTTTMQGSRVTFNDPSPNAPPIPASLAVSSFMSARDLCYVIHTMMKPLHSLDAYNDDYYRWSYDDRKSRNLLMLGGSGGRGRSNLPNPVWKETKAKARVLEDTYRKTVETRAHAWSKNKQVLGHNVKVNVKRPRAILATSVLSSTTISSSSDKKEEEEEEETREERDRAMVWTARLAIDTGYSAFLNLVELRRLLLQSSVVAEERRLELLSDVQDNVKKLHYTFGVTESSNNSSSVIDMDDKMVARTLSMPKGRMLLSRVMDEGVLPHLSACHVLPVAIGVLPPAALIHSAPPPGEDRLLRSLTALVHGTRPSVHPRNLLDCLDSVMRMNDHKKEKNNKVRTMLGGQRTRMELLHSILSRGNEICLGGEFEEEWKSKEREFIALLSSPNE